ncbi:MAG: hypothetical protein ACM37W_10875 [Actinomycetota bacterium]
MSHKISAPKVYLFAFQLCRDSEGRSNPLWRHCDNILAKFTDHERVTPHLVFPRKSPSDRLDLLPNLALKFKSPPPLEGLIQPRQIQDSYAFCFQIGSPKDSTTHHLDLQLIREFNPDRALLLSGDDNFLGQTLLITAWLPLEQLSASFEQLKPIADRCRDALFSGESPPIFYQYGKLLGNPIFEYGSIRNLANNRHLLVWLLREQQTEQNFQAAQQEIFDLFFYYHKTLRTFQDSRKVSEELYRNYGEIEENIEYLQQQFSQARTSLTTPTLDTLKQQLNVLLNQGLSYTRLLRKLEDSDKTMAINLNNYSETLQQICDKIEIDEEELGILNRFSRKNAPALRSQIAGDLSYCQHGIELIEQAIACIRGIVEIEQARSTQEIQQLLRDNERAQQERSRDIQTLLRQKEKQEKQRSKHLERKIQAIGVGLAGGGIVAASGSDKLFNSLVENHEIPAPLLLGHPFAFSVVVSGAIALLAAWISWRWTATSALR